MLFRSVLIHDGDRCLISSEIIESNIKCLNEHGSAVTVIPVIEALFEATDNVSNKYVPRNNLYRIQTPYSYRLSDLLKMYDEALNKQIDGVNLAPCILMQMLGHSSHLMDGSEFNFKITTPDDLKLFRIIKKQ